MSEPVKGVVRLPGHFASSTPAVEVRQRRVKISKVTPSSTAIAELTQRVAEGGDAAAIAVFGARKRRPSGRKYLEREADFVVGPRPFVL